MNLAISLIIGFILTIMSVTPSIGDTTSYLPVSHRAYDFLDRMEHYFYISGVRIGTKPLTRADVAQLLFRLSNKSGLLTEVDREELHCLLDEFRSDFHNRHGLVWDDQGPVEHIPGFLKDFVYRNRRNLYSVHGDNYTMYFDPVIVNKAALGKLHQSSENDNVYTSSNGFNIRGTVGDHMGFHIDVRDSREWGSRDYPENTATTMPGRGFATFKGDRAEFDETSAHLAYSNGPFVVSYGRGENIWGRGRRGTLALSEYASPYDMIRFETDFWRLKFIFFAAEIEQHPPIAKFYYNTPSGSVSDSIVVKKRMSGHRIEIDLNNIINIGLYEAVVYGGRWDWSYLNPLMFLKGAEHSNGDHDNALMGMDFRVFVHRYHSVYGEFFIDDISTTKLGTDWYGNKLAYQLGTFVVHPFGLKNLDSRIEYTRINPWVYTHRYPINTYTHYGDVLGYPTGPNSDELFFEIRKRFTRRFHSSLSFSKRRHGANPEGRNIGGNPLEGFKNGDSTKAKFLAGDVEKANAVSFDLSYEILWQLFARVGYTYEDIDGDGINIYRFSLGLNE